jgi:hypothetical protein
MRSRSHNGRTPAERRTACIKLLAEFDQLIAEWEGLNRQPILADDELEYLDAHLELRRQWRERVERILANRRGLAHRRVPAEMRNYKKSDCVHGNIWPTKK